MEDSEICLHIEGFCWKNLLKRGASSGEDGIRILRPVSSTASLNATRNHGQNAESSDNSEL